MKPFLALLVLCALTFSACIGIPGVPGLTQEIIPYDKIKRVDFANRALKDQIPVMECQIDKPNVILMTLKKAEDDEGIIIRLNETEGRDTEVSITLPHTNIDKAYETNLVEVNGRLLDVQGQTIKINVRAFGVQTIRIIS